MNPRPWPSGAATVRTRILVVEETRRLLHALLQFLAAVPGVEVIGSAGSPEEAALQVDRLAPELVLIDWSLPRGAAEASCRLMLARPTPPRIVALLDDDDDAHRAFAAAAGTDATLGKGRLSEVLVPLLDELFPVRQS